MDLTDAMLISAQGMRAQGGRMKVISENVANANTAANTPEELPYQRQIVTFKTELDRATGVETVAVDKIVMDQSDFRLKLQPGHPGADENGYIRLPNVNMLVETMDMREAQRSYEANLNMIELSRSMVMRTVDMLRE